MQRILRLGEWRKLGQSVVTSYITYLLDVVFTDYLDDAAPVTSPIVGRAGQLTAVQTDGTIAITSGQLVFTAQSTPVIGDQGLYNAAAIPTEAGLTAGVFGLNLSTAAAIAFPLWKDQADVIHSSGHGDRYGAYLATPNFSEMEGTLAAATVGTVAGSVDYAIIVTMRNGGAYLWRKTGTGGYIIEWPSNQPPPTTLYTCAFGNITSAGVIDIVRAASLANNSTYPVPALGTRDLDLSTPGSGTGTSKIASPVAGNTFVHTADTVIRFSIDAVPAPTSTVQIDFRDDGANNFLRIFINVGSNYFNLWKYISGSGSNAAGYSATPTAGDVVTIICNDESIKGYRNDTLMWSYTIVDAVLLTGTGGDVQSKPVGWTISNLEARTLDGIANASSSNHPGKGLATDVLPGPRAAGDTFTHEADAVIEFTLDALGVGDGYYRFRQQDINNAWFVLISSGGTLSLYEKVAGVDTLRGSAVGVLSGGERIVIVANGTTIKGYYNTTLAWTYASATNFQTQTSGLIGAASTDRRSNLITWPLDLADAPNTPEAANVKAAFDQMATP